ncbi:hypothetical protein [Nocardia thailandica]|uniref:hypothetical protein n=1 Tax=Nocardia thailandica TaxID=257275 RepID=UPI0002D34F9C|nr:hypothetical protein [Nocardia thailandica]
MNSDDLAKLLDPEAWAFGWSTLGEAIEIQTRRERSQVYAERLIASGYTVVKRPTCGPPEEKTSGVVEPLVLEDLRRMVAATQDWSPVTIVQVARLGSTLNPKRGASVLTAVRGSLAAHRKRDLK